MKKLNIAIIIVSNTRTARTDKSGNLLKKLIINDGHKVFDKKIVPDDVYQIRSATSSFIINKNIDVIIRMFMPIY